MLGNYNNIRFKFITEGVGIVQLPNLLLINIVITLAQCVALSLPKQLL